MLLKRIFDIIFSTLLLVATLPIWVLIPIAIKLTSKGSVFYKSERVGKDGIRFYLYKFRSMIMGADRLGMKISAESDTRQTRVGRIIRKWKIDELPNLLNVLKGEMSIVGPRPEAPEYIEYYSREQREVLQVKPGITDMAVSGRYRNEQQILDNVEDQHAYYVNVILKESLLVNLNYAHSKPSLLRDIRIIFRTFVAVLFKS